MIKKRKVFCPDEWINYDDNDIKGLPEYFGEPKKKVSVIGICIEFLKWVCFTGFLFAGVYKENLFNLIFYLVALISFIILKENYNERR